MIIKNSTASIIGLALGLIWLILGFTFDSRALIMFGSLVFGMGLLYRFLKEPVQSKTKKINVSKRKPTNLLHKFNEGHLTE